MNTSLITFLLDRSGSMDLCKEATIEGFNAYLATLQAEKESAIEFTHLQFDTVGIDVVHLAVPVCDAHPLTFQSYQPRASTPLIDAATKTIKAVEKALAARSDSPKVVICIQTDGQENSSKEYTWEELKHLITQKTEAGWEFNFLGAGINAYDQGARMGISAANTMSYNHHDSVATAEAFTASASNASDYSAGRSLNAAYSAGQRIAAGDRFVPDSLKSTPSPGAKKKKPSRTIAPTGQQAVPDISL